MGEYVATVTQKGQVTIPSELRRALGLKPGDKVAFNLIDGEVHLLPVRSRVMAGFGAVEPARKPEDFRKIRLEVEDEAGEGYAQDV